MRYKERGAAVSWNAAFASPEIYEYLEAEALLYVIRLKANAILQRNTAYAPVGRPPDHVRRFHASFSYQAVVEQEAPCRGQSGVAPRRGFLASVSSH